MFLGVLSLLWNLNHPFELKKLFSRYNTAQLLPIAFNSLATTEHKIFAQLVNWTVSPTVGNCFAVLQTAVILVIVPEFFVANRT